MNIRAFRSPGWDSGTGRLLAVGLGSSPSPRMHPGQPQGRWEGPRELQTLLSAPSCPLGLACVEALGPKVSGALPESVVRLK